MAAVFPVRWRLLIHDASFICIMLFNIAVNRTEMVSVLLGVNNCSCTRLESLQSLYFAVSNPDNNELDVTCPIYTRNNSCYSPGMCSSFINEDITAFFHICENSSGNTFSLCSSNVTEQLDGLRLDFYTLTKPTCASVYYSRNYIQSFEFKGEYITRYIYVHLLLGVHGINYFFYVHLYVQLQEHL